MQRGNHFENLRNNIKARGVPNTFIPDIVKLVDSNIKPGGIFFMIKALI